MPEERTDLTQRPHARGDFVSRPVRGGQLKAGCRVHNSLIHDTSINFWHFVEI